MAGGASVPPSSSLADGRAAQQRRIEPRARLRGAEAGLAAAGLGSGDARAGHGRPQLASPRLVPDRSRGGGARAEVRRRGALPAQAERLAAEFGERRWRDSGSARPLPYCSLLSRPPWWRRW